MNINPTPRQRGYWLSVVVKLGSGNKDTNPHNNITKKRTRTRHINLDLDLATY